MTSYLKIFLSAAFATLPFYNALAKKTAAPATLQRVTMSGYIGERVDACISKRIMGQNSDELVEQFRLQDETQQRWASEFWGKWVQGAIASYQYNHDQALYEKIKDAEDKLMALQLSNGYIGDYDTQHQLTGWDVWGRKYTLLGLIKWYRVSGDKKALKSACRLLDYTISQIGPGKKHIYQAGLYRGMPPSSILEPVMFLYNETHDSRYLDFAKFIVEDDESSGGPQLIAKADEPVALRFTLAPKDSWWSFKNGQKAYEMMSCYVGLLELYRVTGNEQYRKSAETAYRHIVNEEINICGSGASMECWYGGRDRQTFPAPHTMETCVTFTWMQFCERLLEFSHNSLYVDQIERTMYNALMASLKNDASQIVKYTPLEGFRREGENQCEVHINCCNANAPRAFAMIPRIMYRCLGEKNLDINLYIPSTARVQIDKQVVTFIQSTDYPRTNEVQIKVSSEKSVDMSLNLRIPEWSDNTIIEVNGQKESNVKKGSYFTLNRTWNNGDCIRIQFDMKAHIVELNQMQAIERGPVVFARDTRFNDGFVDEVMNIPSKNGIVELKPIETPKDMWMAFTVAMIHGTYSDMVGDKKQVHLCDFASAGNTWDENTRYRVWIPKLYDTEHGGNKDLKGYW